MAPDVRRHVPALFFTEVSQTIWKKVCIRGELLPEDGREIVRRLMILPMEVHPLEPLFEASFELALRTGRTVYDSVYLSLALMKGWKFITADERLRNALQGHEPGRSVVWVGDVPSLFPEDRT